MPSSTILQKDFKKHPLLRRLLELHDIPEKLYLRGKLPQITIDEYGRAIPRILTIVGSRKYTEYGKNALQKIIRELEKENIIILSGLALGIDGLAHKEALLHNLTTIAIPGSGLDPSVIYPKSNLRLAEDIVEKNGALISELEDSAPPMPWSFLQRNRLMAALADAVLIVEAEEKSGTLVTAKLALELGRDIGAIPGNIFSPNSSGANMLIRNGAYPITSGEDVMSLLHLSPKKEDLGEDNPKTLNSLSKNEILVLSLLSSSSEKDELYKKSQLPLSSFLSAFSMLELNGYIEESFGEVRRMV